MLLSRQNLQHPGQLPAAPTADPAVVHQQQPPLQGVQEASTCLQLSLADGFQWPEGHCAAAGGECHCHQGGSAPSAWPFDASKRPTATVCPALHHRRPTGRGAEPHRSLGASWVCPGCCTPTRNTGLPPQQQHLRARNQANHGGYLRLRLMHVFQLHACVDQCSADGISCQLHAQRSIECVACHVTESVCCLYMLCRIWRTPLSGCCNLGLMAVSTGGGTTHLLLQMLPVSCQVGT